MGVSVDTDWFNTIYSNAIEALENINNKLGESFDIGEYLSQTQTIFIREYIHLRSSFATALNTMACDWNAIKVCVDNFTHFDSYVSRITNNQPTDHMEYGCDSLWRNTNETNINANRFDDVLLVSQSGNDYISQDTIQDLTTLINKLNELADLIDVYRLKVVELANNNGFSGATFDAIKSYMARVHIPVINSMMTSSEAFADRLGDYQSSYLNNDFDNNYVYNVSEIKEFKKQLENSYRNIREKIHEFNSYVWTQNANRYNCNLEGINHYCIDNTELRINSQISGLDGIINIINSNESNGMADARSVQSYVDSLDSVLAELGTSMGYRMINPNRQFESINDLSRMTLYADNDLNSLLASLLEANSSNHDDAQEALISSIQHALIACFDRGDENHYGYNAYRYYDEANNGLNGNLDSLKTALKNRDFLIRWGDLYNSMLDNGYTRLNALRYSSIAALYNREGMLSCSDVNNEHDSIVIGGIRNYVVDFTGFVANSTDHGYDQGERWGTFGEFDCVSLVVMAYEKAFINLRDVMGNNNPLSGDMVTCNLSPYGFKEFKPNEDINLDGLIPGDIFAVDVAKGEIHNNLSSRGDGLNVEYWDSYNEEDDKITQEQIDNGEDNRRSIGHVEMFYGKVDNNGRTEYLNVSAHSSEQIYFSDKDNDDRFGNHGDQLQINPSLLTKGTNDYDRFYYNFSCLREEGKSFDPNATGVNYGRDQLHNDRIGEIRFENIGPRPEWGRSGNRITGYVFWPHLDDEHPAEVMWDRILRLESMDYWKTAQ